MIRFYHFPITVDIPMKKNFGERKKLRKNKSKQLVDNKKCRYKIDLKIF